MPAARQIARTLTAQQEALIALGVRPDRVYVEHGLIGIYRARPGLREAMAACRLRFPAPPEEAVPSCARQRSGSEPDQRDPLAVQSRDVAQHLPGQPIPRASDERPAQR
jgi:hypothetical protein